MSCPDGYVSVRADLHSLELVPRKEDILELNDVSIVGGLGSYDAREVSSLALSEFTRFASRG
jgi:hypothetical protein